MSVAYWGPEIKVGAPQKALSINMDAATNIESVSCSFNSQGRVMPIVYIQNQQTHVPIPIPIPDITPLNPPLGLIPPIPLNFEPIDESAKYSPDPRRGHRPNESGALAPKRSPPPAA